jgi:hypothetical protein
MRQKLITLCPVTWELASKKSNFSAWIRDKLRQERNMRDLSPEDIQYQNQMKINKHDELEEILPITTRELLFHLEQLSDSEMKFLVSILKKV